MPERESDHHAEMTTWAEKARQLQGEVERLADALRDVLDSHYCGQITCSIALSRLNEYEATVGQGSYVPTRATYG